MIHLFNRLIFSGVKLLYCLPQISDHDVRDNQKLAEEEATCSPVPTESSSERIGVKKSPQNPEHTPNQGHDHVNIEKRRQEPILKIGQTVTKSENMRGETGETMSENRRVETQSENRRAETKPDNSREETKSENKRVDTKLENRRGETKSESRQVDTTPRKSRYSKNYRGYKDVNRSKINGYVQKENTSYDDMPVLEDQDEMPELEEGMPQLENDFDDALASFSDSLSLTGSGVERDVSVFVSHFPWLTTMVRKLLSLLRLFKD
jgi:hypothetical protein